MLKILAVGIFVVGLVFYMGCGPGPKEADMKTIEINQGWQFHKKGDQQWHDAVVPGCVHTDLMANELIDDPFYRDNENKLQWIEHEDWVYQTGFTVDQELLQKQNIEIVFHGLDTYAQVYLNDVPVLATDNMFRQWRADVKALLKPAENLNMLRIHFFSPIKKVEPAWRQLGVELPGGPKVMTRKPGYHYGWDWGPRLVTSGIWRPVVLEAWNHARIQSLQLIQNSLSPEKATLTAVFEIQATSSLEKEASIVIEDRDSNNVLARAKLHLATGTQRAGIEFSIDGPKAWWSNGLGEPHLYHLKARLELEGRLLDEVSQSIGLRTVELVRKKSGSGESFYFTLNGIPLFIKGANYIPQDSFLNRVTADDYKSLVSAAKAANMNMLRVWGGGIYENDIFYQLCDEAGILVWQDFMFACAMYPGDEAFLENVRQEAVENVKRLRHHPCIALWCGNNEIDEAWHNWGWQPSFSPTQQERLWQHYQTLFHEILPGVVKQYDKGRFYWPSSPRYGRSDPRSLSEGNAHYWGVWHDEEPFAVFKKKIPRFMSEYGFQAFPPLETVKRFTIPEDRHIESEVMMVHQKHPRGNQLIKTYMERDYHIPGNFEHFLYLSQVLQAEGMKIGIEAHRRAKPYCMGTLYWQLNDCWPAVSWSGIDYYDTWKALHYFVKTAYKPLLVSLLEEKGKLKVYIVSDRLQPVEGTLALSLKDFSGNLLWDKVVACRIAPNTSRCCFEIGVKKLLEGKDKRKLVFLAGFQPGQGEHTSACYYFVRPKELLLSDPCLKVVTEPGLNGFKVTLSCESLAKNVYLSIDGIRGFFSDNFFDLMPFQAKVVHFSFDGEEKIEMGQFERKLKIMSLFDTSDVYRGTAK